MPPLHCWDIAAVSLAHPLLCSSLLVFCVPPFPPYLPPSVKHTALPICSLSLLHGALCRASSSSLFPAMASLQRGDIYTWEAHLGYSCAAAIAASCVGRWVSVCVFCMHVFVLCIRVCVGGIHLSGAAIQGRSSHLGLQMSLPLHIVLKLLSAASLCVLALPPSLPLALCWCLSLAHCCVTISHRHCSERIGRDPTSWGVEGCMCTCLENMAAVRPSILQACFVHVSVRVRVWETEVIYVLQFVRTCKERDIGFRRKLLRAVLPH